MFDPRGRLSDLERRRRQLDAEELAVLAQLESEDVCDRHDGLRTADWWAREHGLPVGACRRRVRVAAKVGERFDRVVAAIGDGRVSWRHAQVFANVANPRVTPMLIQLQDQLIDLAEVTGFAQWEKQVRAIVAQLDLDGGHDPTRDRNSWLKITPTLDGTRVTGWLTGEAAVTIGAAVERLADELFRTASRDHETCPDLIVPPRGELRSRALAELCRRGLARDLTDSRPPVPECTLVLGPDGEVTTPDGVVVDEHVLSVLGNDPLWRFLRFDARGAIIEFGRGKRHATPELRRALAVRDGGCVFPGCGAPPSWCDAHHVVAWEHGGTTDHANLALLCRHHHGVSHRNGWAMHATDAERFWWTTPTGGVIESQRYHDHNRQQHRQPEPIGA